jgi:hypothetical protein
VGIFEPLDWGSFQVLPTCEQAKMCQNRVNDERKNPSFKKILFQKDAKNLISRGSGPNPSTSRPGILNSSHIPGIHIDLSLYLTDKWKD